MQAPSIGSMKIFVTGGSGFVGGHVIRWMLGKHEVCAMARSEASAASIAAAGATAVRCSLSTITARDLLDVDAVIHCAAYVKEWGTRDQFWSTNVDRTTRLLEASREAGVQRFVHIGTEAALFDGRDLIDIDESQPTPRRHKFLYSETKAEAERCVLAANEADRFETLSVRPRLVWGPGDTTILPAILKMLNAGKWRWLDFGNHETSTTHIFNLMQGIELAMRAGRGGEAYFVDDVERSSLYGFFSRLVATQGRELPDRSLSGRIARPLAWLVESIWRLGRFRSPPPMSRFAISMMSRSVTIRSNKARLELNYQPIINVDEGMHVLEREARDRARRISIQLAPPNLSSLNRSPRIRQNHSQFRWTKGAARQPKQVPPF